MEQTKDENQLNVRQAIFRAGSMRAFHSPERRTRRVTGRKPEQFHLVMAPSTMPMTRSTMTTETETAAIGYPRERSSEQRVRRPLAIRDSAVFNGG
jgi:hypothetical protein